MTALLFLSKRLKGWIPNNPNLVHILSLSLEMWDGVCVCGRLPFVCARSPHHLSSRLGSLRSVQACSSLPLLLAMPLPSHSLRGDLEEHGSAGALPNWKKKPNFGRLGWVYLESENTAAVKTRPRRCSLFKTSQNKTSDLDGRRISRWRLWLRLKTRPLFVIVKQEAREGTQFCANSTHTNAHTHKCSDSVDSYPWPESTIAPSSSLSAVYLGKYTDSGAAEWEKLWWREAMQGHTEGLLPFLAF